MLKKLCTQGKKVCNILWCEKSYQTRVSQRYCISWGLMYSLFWIESLAIQKFFPATDFCFTWESLFQLKCNLHFSPNLLALLSSSGKFDRDVFNYTNKLSSRQVLHCIIDFGHLNGKFCSWNSQIPCAATSFYPVNGFHTSQYT